MKVEQQKRLLREVREHSEAIPDDLGAESYRCAVRLTDGLYLPCVHIQNSRPFLRQMLRRLSQTKGKHQENREDTPVRYIEYIEAMACERTVISWNYVGSVECSPYAISYDLVAGIEFTPDKPWYAFEATMDDGSRFLFGTTHSFMFFEMPPGYSSGRIRSVRASALHEMPSYREKPFFECFLDWDTEGK